jgi:fumarate reductase flavoprotein subunit
MKTPQVIRQSQAPAGEHVPVVIVGAGACGLTAALALSRSGIDCVVLERDAVPAGSTALSSGFVPAAGTRAQAAQGIVDDAEQFAQDIQAKAHGEAAPHLVAAYSSTIARAIDALGEHHGIAWQVLDNFLYPGHRVHRMHAVPERSGAGLMNRLRAAADAAGIPVLSQARVVELWVNEARQITGVGCERRDGSIEHVGCQVLVLACNGFGGNEALRRELLPDMADSTYAGHVGNDGSAIQWGRQLGARLADLGGYQGHGSWAIPQGALISWSLMMEGAIQVNAQGLRFHDETQGYSEAAVKVLAQPGGVAWNIFDEQLLAFAQEFPDFRDAQSAGAVKQCRDLDSLADLIGCRRNALEVTLSTVTPGTDVATGRAFGRKLQAPPWYAVKVTGALFHTQGGLDIDAQCRVLDQQGRPFANLLAAGGAARGVSGNAVWGYLSGNGLLSAVAGGHISAQTATSLLRS